MQWSAPFATAGRSWPRGGMTPAEAVGQARTGKLLPIYVVAGEERLLRDEVVSALRDACLAGGVAAFNEDKFTAGEANPDSFITDQAQ